MKKFLLFLLFFFNVSSVFAQDKIEVSLAKCVDGDTAYFIYDGEKLKTRFIAIDAPETKHPKKEKEPYGDEASTYTCKQLTNAKKIEIEYDVNCEEKDIYGRTIVWVFVDGKLLQEDLVSQGLAKVAYLYDNYKYVDLLQEAEINAKEQRLNIWGEEETSIDYSEYIVIALLGLLFIITGSKWAKRNFKKRLKRKISKL